MIGYLIDHLKLSHRLYAGYFLSGAVALSIMLFTFLTFLGTTNDFQNFVAFSQKSHFDLRLTAKVAEIQRQALLYSHDGHQSAAEQVTRSYEALSDQLQGHQLHENANFSPLMKNIRKHLDSYYAAFLQLKQQRDRQENLLNIELRKHASEVEALINQLIVLSQNQPTTSLNLLKALNTLLQVEKNVFRYLDSSNNDYLLLAKNNLLQTFNSLNNISSSLADAKLHSIHKELKLYQKSLTEAVQRRRGYMYLVNVVMAAEAYEVLYQSKKLSTLIGVEMDSMQKNIQLSINHALSWLMIFAVGLLLMLLLSSYAIGRSIKQPIIRLSKTFAKLAIGDKTTEIQPYLLQDELRELTEAAKAFRDKNIQTERLLEEARQLTQDLEQSKKDLERSNNELEQFVYTVSHDLKSPLVTSMGFIGIIKTLAGQGKTNQALEKLDKVVKANERMGQLINDLLELSRVGRIDFDKKSIDLNILLAEFSQEHAQQIQETGLALIIQPQLPTIYGNESRILQVFENLLSNVLKYAIRPETIPTLEIGSIQNSTDILIFCRDNGPGVAEEFHDKIFALFYRLDPKREGTGIGLAIAKKVMKFHDGDIWLESKPGHGATFWLKFPFPPTL